jgi:hypothetical protein
MFLVKIESTNLWENISSLPDELKAIIGDYSRLAYMEKILIRLQYFKQWSVENVHRIIEVVRKWTKKQVVWLLIKCNLYNYTHSVMNKQTLINVINARFRQAISGCMCVKHTRVVWQRLKAIEISNNVFVERKRLFEKQKRVEKKARAKEEQEAAVVVVRVRRIHFEGEQFYKSVTTGVVYNTERDPVGIWNEEDLKIEFDAVVYN